MKFLIAGDTYPENPWSRERLPAMREALKGYDHEIIDLFEFNSEEEAHEIRRTNTHKEYFAKCDLADINRKFIEKVIALCSYQTAHAKRSYCIGHAVLVLGTLDCVSLFLFPETIKLIQEQGIKVVCFFGDDEFMLQRHSHWVDRFDKCGAYVRWCADYYNNIVPGSTYYLPWGAYFPEEDFDKLQIKKEGDVVFVGAPFDNPDGERPKCLRALIENKIDVSIYGGEGWETIHNGFFKKHYKGYLPVPAVPETLQKYKISLAFLEDHLTGSVHNNANIWLAARAGVACISTYYDPLFKEYGFKERVDIVTFHSSMQLVDLTKAILNNGLCGLSRGNHTKVVAKSLFNHVKENFNFVNLYKDFFKSLEDL